MAMRRIGFIGGTSWLSTVEYYRLVNLMVNERLGGREYAQLSLDSINFGDLIRNNEANDHKANELILVEAAGRLAASGATAILICANTPHMFANAIEVATNLPVIHIAKATAAAIKEKGLSTVGLLGTRLTMENDVYHSILSGRGIECLTPNESEINRLNLTIFGELGRGEFTDELRAEYLAMIDGLKQRGAQGVIFGCTEIPLLLGEISTTVLTFDTVHIHASAAVDFMLGSSA